MTTNPVPPHIHHAIEVIAAYLRAEGFTEMIISRTGGAAFRFLSSFNDNFTAEDVRLLEAQIERAHQFLDECYIGGDGTEPLVERIGAALAAARGSNAAAA
jgi:GGDEF domain-containing protein